MDALIAAAQEEGGVTFYESPSGIDEAAAAAFQEAYGIPVNVVRLNSTELIQRFSAEADAGANAADVWLSGDDGFVEDATANGWLIDDLASAGIPGFPGEYPADMLEGPKALMQKRPFGIGYNTDAVDSPPTSWQDLLDPSYDGQIVMAAVEGSDAYVELWDALALEFGEELLTGIAAQDLTIFDSGAPAIQALAAGEGLVEIPATGGLVASVASEGAPVELVYPDATYATSFVLAMPAEPPHPNAACLLASWLMSPEGQAVISDAATVPSPVYEADQLPANLLPSEWAETRDPARKDEIVAIFNG
jgi:iron(III) transport system substrate-binding protein